MMNEPRRFLRYITPGLVFALEIMLFLTILFPDWAWIKIRELNRENGLSFIVGFLFVSGAFGFLFSLIHHAIFWHCPGMSIDHSTTIRDLVRRNILILFDRRTGNPIPQDAVDRLSAADAWSISTALWYSRAKNSEYISSATARTNSLADLTHSMGTNMVAFFSAIVITVVIANTIGSISITLEPIIRFIFALILGILLFLFHKSSYRRTRQFTEDVINEVLADALVYESANAPVSTQIVLNNAGHQNAASNLQQ